MSRLTALEVEQEGQAFSVKVLVKVWFWSRTVTIRGSGTDYWNVEEKRPASLAEWSVASGAAKDFILFKRSRP